jgi:hypothetical protein
MRMYSKTERESHLRKWAESRLNKRAYARKAGINENTFNTWCRGERRRNTKDCVPAEMVEITPLHKALPPLSRFEGGAMVITLMNGYRIEVSTGGCSQGMLKTVLDVLEAR